MEEIFDVKYDKYSDRYDLSRVEGYLSRYKENNASVKKIVSTENNHLIVIIKRDR